MSTHGDVDLDLLQLIANLTDDGICGTDAIAQAKFEADRSATGTAYRTAEPPFFGLDRPLRALQDAGYIDIDPGMAEFVPPGHPAPGPGEYFIDLSVAGRDVLDRR